MYILARLYLSGSNKTLEELKEWKRRGEEK